MRLLEQLRRINRYDAAVLLGTLVFIAGMGVIEFTQHKPLGSLIAVLGGSVVGGSLLMNPVHYTGSHDQP